MSDIVDMTTAPVIVHTASIDSREQSEQNMPVRKAKRKDNKTITRSKGWSPKAITNAEASEINRQLKTKGGRAWASRNLCQLTPRSAKNL